MNGNASDIVFRDARDRIVNLLGIGLTYPLPDLPVEYPEMVALDQPVEITIHHAQAGVQYLLCDEDGNPLEGAEWVDGGPDTKLTTSKINADVAYTILASRPDDANGRALTTHLDAIVSIKAGLDTTLDAVFVRDGQFVPDQITVDFGSKVTVHLPRSQEGISYHLVKDATGSPRLSPTKRGRVGGIALPSSDLEEDGRIRIKAFRTGDRAKHVLLDKVLTVVVRPDPRAKVVVGASVVAHAKSTSLTLSTTQASSEYELYARPLVDADYVTKDVPDRLEIATDDGHKVYVRSQTPIADWNDEDDVSLIGTFVPAGSDLTIETGTITADTMFIVRAKKKESGDDLMLDAPAVLVRPNPTPRVSVLRAQVESGKQGTVTVERTQSGVAYQLLSAADETPINPPGYHHADRGLEKVRTEVDFVVDGVRDVRVLLPTNPMTATASFAVKATRLRVQLHEKLEGTAKIEVT